MTAPAAAEAATAPLVRWSDAGAWDRFVADSPQGSVFARSAFLDALDCRWEAWQLPGNGGPDAAALIFRDEAGRSVRSPLPFCSYQGVFLPGSTASAPTHRRVHGALDAVERLLRGFGAADRLSWCLHPALTDIRAFSWFNYHAPDAGQFRIDVRYTGRIALAGSMDGVLAGCRSVRRQEFRKAAARFQVERSEDLDLLDRLHDLTFSRQGLARPARERTLLRSLAGAAIQHRFGELLVARDADGAAAGAVLFVFDASTSYYLVAANDPHYRSAGVSTLLFLTGVENAVARGSRAVDVVGMNSPARGDFKTSFGAAPVPYYVVNWDRP